jgi:outer membrane protein
MDELWKQINEYVQQFGKENHYKVILGANGTGSLMYSDKALDITPELTSYINSRYAGE